MEKLANKRKDKRLQCLVPVDGKSGSIFDQTSTVDISKGGIGFISHQKIPVNKTIPVELILSDDDDSVLVLGKVKWNHAIEGTTNYRVGLTFTEVLDGSKTHLKKFLQN